MLTARTFRTANGYCHIMLDKIIFTDTAEPVEVNELKETRTGITHTLIQSVLSGLFVAIAIVGFMTDNLYQGSVFALLAIALAILVTVRHLYPTTPVIYKSDITQIEFKPFIYSIQNPHFIVHYKRGKEWPKKRKIVLAGKKYAANAEEIQQVIDIMEEEFSY
jgi:hypothetical protein